MNHLGRIFIAAALSSSFAMDAARARSPWVAPAPMRELGERFVCENHLGGQIFARTELFFGLSRSGGPNITEREFQAFIDRHVTPRFPDGLTLLSGNGQFKDSSGNIVREGSKELILLYTFSRAKHLAIEAIRTEYKNAFQQESILRVDEQSCVSF